MDSICINAFFGNERRVKKITTGSELLLAYELDKYSRLLLGKRVSLANVSIAKSIIGSEQFSFVVTNGLDVGFTPDMETLADYRVRVGLFFTKTIDGIVFKLMTPELWVYDFSYNSAANLITYGANRSAAYVSMIAYLIVKSAKDGVACPKLLIDHEEHAQLELEYVDLLILKGYGNKLLSNVVDINFSASAKQQPEWEAFVTLNRQRGVMNREYSTTEKYKYFKKHFEVGDVVLLYKRAKGAKGKSINKLISCYPAVIRGFNKTNVDLMYYPQVRTKLTRHMQMSLAENDYDGDLQVTETDLDMFTACKQNLELMYTGVDVCTYLEETFILRPADFDGSPQYFRTENGFVRLFLSTLDTIYAVFEDRGVEYNKVRFLDTYFNSCNRVPVYDEMMRKQGS